MISAIILAAGESKRMGEPKLLLPFSKNTIIGTVVDNTVKSKADHTLVVLGSSEEPIRKAIENLPVEIVVNKAFPEGMLSSIQCGFRALPQNTEAALVVLGDQPFIPSTILDIVIDAYQKSKKGLVLPVYQKRRGHPLLIHMKYKEEVLTLQSDMGLRTLLISHDTDIFEVYVNTPGILRDIDTMEDYNQTKEYQR